MLSLLPTPFWDTNTQMTAAGIEPTGLAVKRTLGKNFKGDPNNLLTCPYCLRGRNLENKMKNKGDVNERNRGRDSNPQRLYDTLISGNHLPNSETSISDY